DGSKESMHACKWACRFILTARANNRQFYNFTLLHVRPPVSISSGPAYIFSLEVLRLLKCDEARTAERISKRALDICNHYNVKVKTHFVTGEPKQKICEAANKLGAHFLVMGSHGHGSFIRAIKGSVSDYCCRNAICPVVVVNKK
ncbi:hypothetical protein KI387_001145, partial [Taxus chinensis]